MFYDEVSAKEVAEKFSKTSALGDMRVYKCMFCDCWHLTHKQFSNRRKTK